MSGAITGAGLIGSLFIPGAGLAKISQGASKAARTAQAAGLGAAEGAAYGFLSGEGEERLTGAAIGAGAGGAKAPKVDIGAELKDLKQQQAKIMDVLGITMTPSEVYSDEQPEEAAPAPEAAAGPEGTSAIQPISPMGSAFPKQGSADMGVAIDHSTTYKDSIGMQQETADKASAWLKMATAKNAS